MKKFLILIYLPMLLFVAGCSEDSSNPSENNSVPAEPEVGEMIPSFKLKTAGGGTFDLSDHKGEVVLFEYWTHTCHICERDMPETIALQEKHKDKPFTVVTVNPFNTSEAIWKEYVGKWNMGSLINVQDDFKLSVNGSKYSVHSYFNIGYTPYFFLVGTDGELLYKGINNKQMFEYHIEDQLD